MVRPTERRRRRSILIGLMVLVLFAGSVFVAIQAHSGLPGMPRTVVRAEFTDVDGLRTGNDVRIGGSRVGQVGEIELVDGKPVVELKFDGDRKVYKNSQAVTASVGARSALGQKYVQFEPGSPDAGVVAENEIIPAGKTEGPEQLADLLAVLDKPTRAGLGSTIREVGGGLAGHSKDMRDALDAMPGALPDLGSVSRALSAGNGADLTTMMRAVNSLSSRFEGRHQQISNVVRQVDRTLEGLAVDDAKPVSAAIEKAPETMSKLRGSLDKIRGPLADTERAATSLRSGAASLGEATPDVRGVLRDSVTPLRKVPGVSGKAVPAVRGLTRTFADARPLAPALRKTVDTAHKPLSVLAPYAPEISQWFTNAADALSQGDQSGHWLRIYPLLNTESVSGALSGLRDPVTARNAYPGPGEAARDKKNSLLGPR